MHQAFAMGILTLSTSACYFRKAALLQLYRRTFARALQIATYGGCRGGGGALQCDMTCQLETDMFNSSLCWGVAVKSCGVRGNSSQLEL
jgi:hypothetical protein